MIHILTLPDDFFGFSIQEMKEIVSGIKGLILTDKEWKYDMVKGYQVEKITQWHLKAKTHKAIKAGLAAINHAKAKRDNPDFEKFQSGKVKFNLGRGRRENK